MSRARAVVVAIWLAACVDGPTSPGRFGELRFRPSYASGDDPAALGLAIDSAAVRIERPAEAAVPLVDSTVAYDSDTASLGWIFDLRAAEESLHVAVTIWGDDTTLYDGAGMVLVRDGVSAPAAQPVPVAYVGPAIVASVTVTPDTVALDALGATAALAAEARDRHGAVVSTTLTWSSADDLVAGIDPTSGVVTAAGNGTTIVEAAAGAAHGSAFITVSQRVTDLAVTPGNTTLTALGATQAFGATAHDRNGHLVAGATIAWSSSDPAVARIDAATGVVTAVAGGSATITAACDGVTRSALVTVNPIADVASITVVPSAATLTAVGATRQFTAEARDAQGNVLAGVQVTWTSSVSAVAAIEPSGIARAVGHGVTTVSAAAGAVVGTATLTVDLSASIASVVVTPATATLTAPGATQQFTASAHDAGGAVVPVVAFAWSSDEAAVATVSGSGLATATGHGSAAISASVSGVSGSAHLTVDLAATVASVIVTPATAVLTAVGATRQFTAEARDAAGHAVPGVPVAWSSSAPGVATVDTLTGQATATGHGTTTITATSGSVSGHAELTVELQASIVTVVVTPDSATLTALGATQAFHAVARDSAGHELPGVSFAWTSSNLDVAAIDTATGIATASGQGVTIITATSGGRSGTATLRVDLVASIASITVTPAQDTLTAVGATRQFAAEARDAGGAVLPGVAFTWSSSAPAVATVDTSGLATARGHGQTTIAATAGGVAGHAQLTVSLSATVASVTVVPASATLTAIGDTQAFHAVVRDTNGVEIVGIPVAWSSSVPATATIDSVTGVATAAGQGATTVTATAGAVSGTAILHVDLAPSIASVTVSPNEATLGSLDATQQFTAVVRDAAGHVLPGVAVTWASGTPSVATIGATSGLAHAAAQGTTAITATTGGVTGGAVLHVSLAASIATITVDPATAKLGALGATKQFVAVARDAQGRVLEGVPIVWTSSRVDVATIDPVTGLATATANGTTSITATSGAVSGTAQLDVCQVVVKVVVLPTTAQLTALQQTKQFTAEARDANGHVVAGVTFTWSSSDIYVAKVDANGLAKAVGFGTARIRARTGGVTGQATLVVACERDWYEP